MGFENQNGVLLEGSESMFVCLLLLTAYSAQLVYTQPAEISHASLSQVATYVPGHWRASPLQITVF